MQTRPKNKGINNKIAVFIPAVIFVSAIPFGSNRPLFWALWCLVMTTAVITYVITINKTDEKHQASFSLFRVQLILFLMYGCALIVQIAPIATILNIGCPNYRCGPPGQLSIAPGDTWFALLRWLTYGMLFFLTVEVAVRISRAERIALMIVSTVTFMALYGLVALTALGDTLLFMDKSYYRGFATGPFVNRNSFATFLGLGAVVGFAMLLSRDRCSSGMLRVSRMKRVFLVAALFLMITTLVETQSRMGLFATVIALCTVATLQFPPGRLARWALCLGAVGVAVIVVVNGSGLLDRVIVVARSADGRSELYRQIIAMISERPGIGYGAGSFRLVFPQFHRPPLDASVTWDYAHSTYLALWSGTGVLIGSLPILIIALIIISMLLNFKAYRARSAVSAAVGATVLVALHSLVDFSIEIQAVAMAYIAILALGSARNHDVVADKTTNKSRGVELRQS